jgi:hypothetical protein
MDEMSMKVPAEPVPSGANREDSNPECQDEVLDPNDSNLLRDRVRGQTTEHAWPPRLEDEGQSGG